MSAALREAARQALEAWDNDDNGTMDHPLSAAIEALRAELEQQEPRSEWQGLTQEEIIDGREQIPSEDLCGWSFRQGAYFAETRLKEKNA